MNVAERNEYEAEKKKNLTETEFAQLPGSHAHYFAIITLDLTVPLSLVCYHERKRELDGQVTEMRRCAQIALYAWVVQAFNATLFAQMPAACKGPTELERVLATHPSAGAYDALGAYFGKRQQLSCAIAAFEAAVHQDPNSWEARFNLSLALLQKHDAARAARELRVAVRIKPDDPLGHIALGEALGELGQNEAAIEEFKLALKSDPKSVPALDGLAKALIAQKRYSAAIAYLKDAPADPVLQDDLAVAYSSSGDVAEAVKLLAQLVQQNPSSADRHARLGLAYTQQSQFRQAVGEFLEALRLDPSNDVTRLSYVKALIILAEFQTALPEIQSYFRRKPHDFDALYLMGVVDRGLGDYAAAEPLLKQAVVLNPNHYDSRYNLGFVLAKLGRGQEALVQLEKAVQLNSTSSEARFQLAAALRSLGQEQRARKELEDFQERKQQSIKENVAGAKVNQANEYFQAGEYQRAVDVYREALAQDPGNARTYYDLALALDHLGKTAEERDALQKAITLDSTIARAHNQLGLISLQAGQEAEAEKELKAAIALDPGYAEAQNNLGVLYGQQGKNKAAEELFRQATENNPQYAQAFINLGLILAGDSRFAEAEQVIRSALKISADNSQALTVLAMVLTRMTRAEEGISYFQKVIELDPKSSGAHLNLGIAYADEFNLEGALAEFSEAVKLDPNSALAHYNKGRVLLDLRRDQDAKPALETAVRLNPQYAEPWYLLGLIEKSAGHPSEAVQALRKSAELDSRNPDTLFVLGQELLHTGDRAGAIAQWRKVIEINPEHGKALYNLSRQLAQSDPDESKRLQSRFDILQAQKQIIDRAQTLGNFALASAAAHDWPEAISQLKEGIQVCGGCTALGQLHKDLGLIYLHSGDTKKGLQELFEAKKLTPADPDIDKAIRIAQTARK
jgi:tetratricopeptide (TPR) repeat protein